MRIESVYYVNLYLIDRGYGGPEEGGWWYEYGEFIEPAALFTDEDEALAYARKLNDDNPMNEGRPDISSVNSMGRYTYLVQDRPGRDYPEARPYYE